MTTAKINELLNKYPKVHADIAVDFCCEFYPEEVHNKILVKDFYDWWNNLDEEDKSVHGEISSGGGLVKDCYKTYIEQQEDGRCKFSVYDYFYNKKTIEEIREGVKKILWDNHFKDVKYTVSFFETNFNQDNFWDDEYVLKALEKDLKKYKKWLKEYQTTISSHIDKD